MKRPVDVVDRQGDQDQGKGRASERVEAGRHFASLSLFATPSGIRTWHG